jgi:heptosyltransferase-2
MARAPLDLSNLLIVIPNWVGDVVLATPTLRAVRQGLPDSRITYLMKPYVQDVLHGCPWSDATLLWPDNVRSLAGMWRFGRALRQQRYSAILLLTNSFRTAAVAWLSSVPQRIGYARDYRGPLLTHRIAPLRDGRRFRIESMLDYYGRLANALGCQASTGPLELWPDDTSDGDVGQWWDDQGLDSAPVVMLNPGGKFGLSKLYPAERFAEIGRALSEDGARVIITGGPGEDSIVRNVADAMNGTATVLQPPELNLRRLKSIIRRSKLLITNDTGPRHFAIALGTPVVTIFGPTHPGWTETHCPIERQVQIDIECGPCQKPVCPLGHQECMTRIAAQQVLEPARQLLAGSLPVGP